MGLLYIQHNVLVQHTLLHPVPIFHMVHFLISHSDDQLAILTQPLQIKFYNRTGKHNCFYDWILYKSTSVISIDNNNNACLAMIQDYIICIQHKFDGLGSNQPGENLLPIKEESRVKDMTTTCWASMTSKEIAKLCLLEDVADKQP